MCYFYRKANKNSVPTYLYATSHQGNRLSVVGHLGLCKISQIGLPKTLTILALLARLELAGKSNLSIILHLIPIESHLLCDLSMYTICYNCHKVQHTFRPGVPHTHITVQPQRHPNHSQPVQHTDELTLIFQSCSESLLLK